MTSTPRVKVEFRLSEAELAAVDAAARARCITRGDYLRQLVAQSLMPPVTRRGATLPKWMDDLP